MSDDEEIYPIGVELGSHTLRIGICGEEGPRHQFPNCFGTDGENTLIGKDDFETRIDYKLTYPFRRGLLKNETDWDKVEKILDYAFVKLKCSPKSEPFVCIEKVLNKDKNNSFRKKMAEILFEKYGCPSFLIIPSEIGITTSCGKFDGLGIDLGYSTFEICPVISGKNPYPKSVTDKIKVLDFAGEDLISYNAKYLVDNKIKVIWVMRNLVGQNILEKGCYVAENYSTEINSVSSHKVDLPDDKSIEIKDLRINCPEIMFNPSLINKTCDSLPDAIINVVESFSSSADKELLYKSICLGGGLSKLKGLRERLTRSLKEKAPANMKDKIDVKDEGYPSEQLNWIAMSILSQMPPIKEKAISKKEYNENGASILDKKLIYF